MSVYLTHEARSQCWYACFLFLRIMSCMRVCLDVYIYIYMNLYSSVLRMYVRMYALTCVCVRMYVRICICTPVLAYAHFYVCECVCICLFHGRLALSVDAEGIDSSLDYRFMIGGLTAASLQMCYIMTQLGFFCHRSMYSAEVAHFSVIVLREWSAREARA